MLSHVSGLRVDRIDVAEVESVRGYDEPLPRESAINGAQDSRSRATGPGHLLTHGAHAPQPLIDAACLHRPARRESH